MRKLQNRGTRTSQEKEKLAETKNGCWIPQFKTKNRRRSLAGIRTAGRTNPRDEGVTQE